MQVKKFHDFNEVEKTDYFCPNCGVNNVYQELGEGDYYQGPSLYCLSCKFDFTMPSCGVDETLEFKE